ncbi:MAG: MFS transporter [Saccharospirillaceae bacterium]|nr:MFS transporter [Pseudomonadales bacterium]NRB79698.1 MFS transporter [Saccharospirillaceae bacterium]
MSQSTLKSSFLSFTGRAKVLHMTWFAFFVTFLVWFSHVPFKDEIIAALNLQPHEWKIILILNVALTIPARIVTGMLVDKYGPRKSYAAMLLATAFLCFFFAVAQSFEVLALAKFLMGFVGAGFVIGIRMISEWFPAKQLGLAEGIYKGMGNVGSAVGAATLGFVAAHVFGDGENAWRYAIASTGVIALIYSVFYYREMTDTPAGSTYFRPNKSGGLELTSKRDFIFCLLINIPMVGSLAALTWRVTEAGINVGLEPGAEAVSGLISNTTSYIIYALLLALYMYQARVLFSVNKSMLQSAPMDQALQYKFKQVAILSVGYAVTFGAELAVISMLVDYFKTMNFGGKETWLAAGMSVSIFGASFAAVDVLSCPSGGIISDKFGRKKPLVILLTGAAIGFFVMSQITESWHLSLVVMSMMVCSFFLGSAAGCVFAVVPLVKRKLTGQIAGTVGAYGNVGAVVFLLVFSFVSTSTFFFVIACGISFAVLCALFLDEPQGHMTEVLADGTIQKIDLS